MIIEVDIFALLKFLGIIVAVAVFVFLIYRIYHKILSWLRGRKYEFDKTDIKRRWQEIEKMIHSKKENDWRLAILEADKLLDLVLKSMAMPGKDLAERLRFASFKYTNLKKVWWSHGIRNRLVHEPSFYLSHGLAKRTIKKFKKALEEVGSL